MEKKGQSISINTIIIAAIALAVLVVLFAIFTGRIGKFSTGVNNAASCFDTCSSVGMERDANIVDPGNCVSDGSIEKRYLYGTFSDVTANQICCCQRAKGRG